jgi:hypothetical protein
MTRKKLRRRKRRIQDRLLHRQRKAKPTPVLEGGNVRYEVADRVGAIGVGGIGMIHLLCSLHWPRAIQRVSCYFCRVSARERLERIGW